MTGFTQNLSNLPPGVAPSDIPGNDASVLVQARRGHRRKFGKHHRVQMGGATVDKATDKQASVWCGKSLSLGLLLDQLVAFARKKGFKPNRNPLRK